MGIRGLGGFLKWKVPNARSSLSWAAWRGKTWAIDCSCILYRARAAGLTPITVLASLLVRMRRAGIEPIVIFDGRPPAAKSAVIDQRRIVRVAAQKEMADLRTDLTDLTELTEMEKAMKERKIAELQKKAPTVSGADKDDIKKFLYGVGVLFVTANGEADDVLALVCKRGDVHAVVSTDMDMLARGVPTLIVPETNDASVLTAIRLDVVLNGLGLTYGQFVDACTLMGSDYASKSWRPVDPATAVLTARRGVDWTSIDASGCVCDTMMEGARLLRGDGAVWEELLGEKQRERWDLYRSGSPIEKEIDNVREIAALHKWPLEWATILLA